MTAESNVITPSQKNWFTLEAVSWNAVIVLSFVSMIIVLGSAVFGLYAIESPFARGAAEETIRLILVLTSIRVFRMVATPAVILSAVEFFVGTAVNATFFGPPYLTTLSYSTVIAICSLLSMTAIGFIAGMIYLSRVIHSQSVIAGFLVVAPTKISFHILNGWIERSAFTDLWNCLLEVSILVLLLVISVIIYLQNRDTIISQIKSELR